ncbi:hypothetical protein MOX02_03110 [Methylobacterium oxalidis]|uniref:Uncharacterized protein n=1 Tax=Methylobacterium oxalidis TaxID=944322 RepID=A0A512IX91_9HYPH|nr:hypothetical protein MOX02_03110 [Methylobacterium oxalidis]GLS62218.1 hypothetical protein GCM10007888_05990 [Methylobacterium oxalidis]
MRRYDAKSKKLFVCEDTNCAKIDRNPSDAARARAVHQHCLIADATISVVGCELGADPVDAGGVNQSPDDISRLNASLAIIAVLGRSSLSQPTIKSTGERLRPLHYKRADCGNEVGTVSLCQKPFV